MSFKEQHPTIPSGSRAKPTVSRNDPLYSPLSQSRVSRVVDQLETRGLVKRSPAEIDGRGVTVSITPEGIDMFKTAQETHLVGLDRRLFSHLTKGEICQLANITQKLLGACRDE